MADSANDRMTPFAGGEKSHSPPPDDLAKLAAKADDLEEIKKAVEDAAAVSGGLWLSYLFVLFYLAVAAGAVTHIDLLLENRVKLPFLSVDLPLRAFFFLAPILFIVTHAYALVHFNMLERKAKRFHDELKRQLPDRIAISGNDEAPSKTICDKLRHAARHIFVSLRKPTKDIWNDICRRLREKFVSTRPKAGEEHEVEQAKDSPKQIRDKLRGLLPSNIFVQILAGPPELRGCIFGTILKLIAWTTLVAFPVLLLLLLQIQFLPYHDPTITWAQRGALVLDIVLLWILRPPTFSGGGLDWRVDGGDTRDAPGHVRPVRLFDLVFAGALSLVAVWLSVVIATIPDEPQETSLGWLGVGSMRGILFAGNVVDQATGQRMGWFSDRLILPGFNLYEVLNVEDPKRLDWKDHLIDLRGRHLEKAVMYQAILPKVNMAGAYLQGAQLDGAELQGASFQKAMLLGASLERAQLQGASLDGAFLTGASLDDAQLQGASLDDAHLEGSPLYRAQLQGASLERAQLQGALLDNAWLEGASLVRAQLQGASLQNAHLQGASLEWAQLQGASLASAQLQAASLFGAQLQGASLDGAMLQGASLEWAQLQGASFGLAQVIATEMSHSYLWLTHGDDARVESIDFDGARSDSVFLYLLGFNELSNPMQFNPDDQASNERCSQEFPFAPDPVDWSCQFYGSLLKKMDDVPEIERRDALDRLRPLGCVCQDNTLSSCGEASERWLAALNSAHLYQKDHRVYEAALATVLKELVCTGRDDAIEILRGIVRNGRLKRTGAQASNLVKDIENQNCPISLTAEDRKLLGEIQSPALLCSG